ncbi:helicase HerA domain-containing protein [Breznakia pachnodae]|uniref:Helicase HerA central domain-containing protein n=1 Tax=Breznakia pachnodae TaxID=265178 RepID=A0ABU0DZC4_9FIRM|nr:DUF87 domain-containing protein [Breznakia pachnodae]MDQ0359987.1 hypothetical protein [Breznakia pachnodae]
MLDKLKGKWNDRRVFSIDKNNYDFLKKICSHSSISWHELYYVNANKYFTCLEIFDYMENSSFGFLNSIISRNNTLVTADISSMSTLEYDKRIENSLEKQDNTKNTTNKRISFRRASKNTGQLLDFERQIDNTKDSVKTMTVRIYLFGKSKEEVQDELDRLVNKLVELKMQGYTQTNALDEDYKALGSFSDPVRKMVSSSTVADMMMRSEINKVDKNGMLIGYTSFGVVAPDIFSFENTSYCMVFMSITGGGKSALFKSIAEGLELRGNHVQFLFDRHGEYREYCKRIGIEYITIDEGNTLNPCQMYYVENTDGIIRDNDIQSKISSLTNGFIKHNSLDLKLDKTVIKQFKLLLNYFYKKYKGKKLDDVKKWIVYGDVLTELKKRIKEGHYRKVAEHDIYVIELGLMDMTDNYGYLYNQRTNLNIDLTKSVCFDISFLQNNDDELVLSSYVKMLLNYVSYGFYLNKKRNEEEMERRNIKIYELDHPLYTCNCAIDEFMDYATDRSFLEDCVSLQKYGRKAFSGLTFMIHATDDLKKGLDNNEDLLSQIFGLSVHKFIGEVDGKSLYSLQKLIPALNDDDIEIIKGLKKNPEDGTREFMGIFNNKEKVPFKSIVNKFQRDYFGGGA